MTIILCSSHNSSTETINIIFSEATTLNFRMVNQHLCPLIKAVPQMNMQIFPVANIVVCGYESWAFAQIFSCLLDFISFTILNSFP